MLFLHPWLLLGLLGVAVPIILHLFNRRKSRSSDWGAMRFLEESLNQRRRRVLIEEILLLVTRCLILAGRHSFDTFLPCRPARSCGIGVAGF